jgi:hypothetical protein
VSLIGHADLDRPISLEQGQLFYPFGGGPFRVVPFQCGVSTTPSSRVDFQLDVVRALTPADSHASLACAIGADYATDSALAKIRELSPSASLTACVLTDWWFRLAPSPALRAPQELAEPLLLAADGLGSARLLSPLSIDSGLLLEAMLAGRVSLPALAEAQFAGVSPRAPAVVEFHSSDLLPDLLGAADTSGALPRHALVGYFTGDVAGLPLTVSGEINESSVSRFADTMADRVIARFGQYVPARDLADGPIVRLSVPETDASIRWSLSQPMLATRRLVLPVDLLSAAQAQVERLGLESVVQRRTFTALPALGRAQVSVLCNLPASPVGVDALGVTLTFPAQPPARPQARVVTALFDGASDIAAVDVTLSPNEPVRYHYSAFAVITDDAGTRQIDAPEREWVGSPLRLSPEHFPIDCALVGVTQALAEQAVISGTCSYDAGGRTHARTFVADSQRSIAIAVPRDHTALRIDCVAIARDGSGEIRLDPIESAQVRLDLSACPTYGPQQVEVRCVFDDATSQRTVEFQPLSSSGEENISALSFTPASPGRSYRWFAPSPFAAGFRYRVVGRQGGAWTETKVTSGSLMLYSSGLRPKEAALELAAKAGPGIRETAPLRPGRNTESVAAPMPEAIVVPVADSPEQEPSDELVYTKLGDTPTPLFVPRYVLDVQTASNHQRYRLSFSQQDTSSQLEVNIVSAKAPSLIESARDAQEYPHTLTIQLEYLVAPPAGARKTLDFTDLRRNGEVVTALLPFATIAERDEVYRALTEPERQSRLIVRRFIDVSVPYEPAPPQPGGAIGGKGGGLPARPFGPKLYLKQVLVPTRVDPSPVVDMSLMAVTMASATLAVRAQPLMLSSVAGAGKLALRESDRVLGTSALMMKHRPILTDYIKVPIGDLVGPMPTPTLIFVSKQDETGQVRLRCSIANWSEFGDGLFAASPDLPPGGLVRAASRTWVDMLDADSGARLYSFCAIGSAQQLADLSFVLPASQPLPARISAKVTDRRTKSEQTSNAVHTTPPQAPADVRPRRSVRQELVQSVAPEPFAFSPALHAYVFQGLTPSAGSTSQLIRHRVGFRGRFHTYLQDASRPSLVYFFPDRFKMARRRDEPFTPYATVRVKTRSDAAGTDVVFDYVVAPHTDPKRLEQAAAELRANPHFGAAQLDFQPFLTSDVRFFVDRPSESGAVREERPDAGLVLQGALKDTLAMSLGDFRLLFDAMHTRTASLFLGRVEIGVPDEDDQVIPFEARLDDLEGDIFSYEAAAATDGRVQVTLTNRIESPVSMQALDATFVRGTERTRGLIEGTALPREVLLPGESIEVTVVPDAAIPPGPPPLVTFDLSGVAVLLDVEQAWDSMLDRSTLDYFRTVKAKAISTLFNPVAGREEEQIVSILVEFEGGGTAELNASSLEVPVRVDYPIDDVVLNRPVATAYRYTVTVIRANNRQDRDAQPRDGSADVFFVSVVR